MNILLPWGNNFYMYAYMVRSGETRSTMLPCDHFDRNTGKWIAPETPPTWEEAEAHPLEQEEVPSWTLAYGYVPYDAGSSNWGYL